jgi:hypothetical protein
MSETAQNEEIVIENAPDEPEAPEIVVASPETPAATAPEAPEPDAALAKLRADLDAERAARADAAERARQAEIRAQEAQRGAQDSDLRMLEGAIETVKGSQTHLKAQYAVAARAGDFEAMAEIQEAMGSNSARLLQLENGKQAMEEQARQPVQPVQHNDPVEALAAQLSPRSAAWVRANPDYARDSRKMQKMIAAHNLVTADGIAPDTDEYFERVEATLGIRRAAPVHEQEADPMTDAAKPISRRSAPPAAPVSRSGNGTGTRPNVVRLTAVERETAADLGMSPEEYARNKLALQREGKLH